MTGENVLIGGFILGHGDGIKKVIVRAIGPSLAAAGVTSALADPNLQVVNSLGQAFATNDDWMVGGQAQEIIDTTLAPTNPKESALVAMLGPGAYTAIVDGAEGTQNIALIEVFDLDAGKAPQLLNISTRGHIDTGEGVMIAGTIIGGTEAETLVFRGLGPSLASGTSRINDPLPDPMLTLVDSQGTTLFTNDNWQDSQASEITGAGLAPTNALESAVLIALSPGNYTALLSDAHSATGIGLVEVYNVTSDQAQGKP
jgi:hypothetical protein